MTIHAVTEIQSRCGGGENCAEWTIRVNRWDNVTDRPSNYFPSASDLPEEVRDAIREWLDGRDY